ncbi:MAG: hypothetical protein HQK51_14715 [Oligoflexia bacterium]|nr:hypothetical protein [Oligoflexia bacterium]
MSINIDIKIKAKYYNILFFVSSIIYIILSINKNFKHLFLSVPTSSYSSIPKAAAESAMASVPTSLAVASSNLQYFIWNLSVMVFLYLILFYIYFFIGFKLYKFIVEVKGGAWYSKKYFTNSFLISFFLVLLFHSDFVFFQTFPLAGFGSELRDYSVSFFNFFPEYALLRYEILNNFNILWTNLRGLGLPILGVEVQAAPLFPLTLLLIWLPFKIFWNVFVVLRFILTAWALYLIAHKIFRLKILSSIFLTATFVFTMYLLRSVNHPYFNAVTAGLWYIFFSVRWIEAKDLKNYPLLLGIIISCYSLITSGFPESMAMMAIITFPFLFIRFIS